MRTIALLIVLASLCASGASSAGRSISIPLNAMNGSGEDGTATFTEDGERTIVTIRLKNGTPERQPSHLHTGTCDDYTPRPAYPLQDVVDGKARTVLSARFDVLVTGAYIVNVHKSYDEIATQAACGVVKR